MKIVRTGIIVGLAFFLSTGISFGANLDDIDFITIRVVESDDAGEMHNEISLPDMALGVSSHENEAGGAHEHEASHKGETEARDEIEDRNETREDNHDEAREDIDHGHDEVRGRDHEEDHEIEHNRREDN